MDKLLFSVMCVGFGIVPGLLLMVWFNLGTTIRWITVRYALLMPLSLVLVLMYGVLTTLTGMSLLSVGWVSWLLFVLIFLSVWHFRFEMLRRLRSILMGDIDDLWLAAAGLGFGLIVVAIPYAGFLRASLVPFNNDALAHQILIDRISESKNLQASTTTVLSDAYEPLTYPYGFHVIPGLMEQVYPDDYKLGFKFSMFIIAGIPLGIGAFTQYLTRSRKAAMLAMGLAPGFALFPSWIFGWGGYALALSITILPVTVVILLDYFRRKEFVWQLGVVGVLLCVLLLYSHVSELVIWLPIIFLGFVLSGYISIMNLEFWKRAGWLLLGWLLLSSPFLWRMWIEQRPDSSAVAQLQQHPPDYDPTIAKIKDIRGGLVTGYGQYKYMFLANDNFLLLFLSVWGAIYLLIEKFREPRIRALFVFLGLFTFLYFDMLSFRIFESLYTLMPWASWERVSYMGIMLFPVLASGVYYMIQDKRQYFVYLMIGVVLVSSMGWLRTYRRAEATAQFISIVSPTDYTAFEWIKNNTEVDSRFLHYSGRGKNEAMHWLPIITDRELVMPYTTHLSPLFEDMKLEVSDALIEASNSNSMASLARDFDTDYFIASGNDTELPTDLPAVYYLDSAECMEMIYPSTENLVCELDFDGSKFISTLDPDQTYIYRFIDVCKPTQPHCIGENGDLNIGSSDDSDYLSGEFYDIEFEGQRDFRWIGNSVIIRIPDNQSEVTLVYRSLTADVRITDDQGRELGVLPQSDNWVRYNLGDPEGERLYLTANTTVSPVGDQRRLSIAIDAVIVAQ